jgi:hypothetical protein
VSSSDSAILVLTAQGLPHELATTIVVLAVWLS